MVTVLSFICAGFCGSSSECYRIVGGVVVVNNADVTEENFPPEMSYFVFFTLFSPSCSVHVLCLNYFDRLFDSLFLSRHRYYLYAASPVGHTTNFSVDLRTRSDLSSLDFFQKLYKLLFKLS